MLRLVAGAESQVIHMDMPVIVFLGSLSRARCRQWLQTLRPVTGVKSQVIHLDMPLTLRLNRCLKEFGVLLFLKTSAGSSLQCAKR